MDRIILHIDMNNFYASVECLYDPSLKNVPMAVGGDKESRHGIVLAKNILAKKSGVKTAEPLWQAKQKCPDIVFVKPHFKRYLKYSNFAKEIYSQYTDQVESFGLDECWLDVTGSTKLFGSGMEIAEEIRARIKNELGLTVSIGVSFNKIFAKLGSDYKKPDAVTEFTRGNFKEKVWALPARDLLYVGESTGKQLDKYGINTIGDIGRSDPQVLERLMGKSGLIIWNFAMGLDSSPVTTRAFVSEVKSIGNSTTTPHDLENDEDVKITLYVLSESVAHRLREQGLCATGVQISIRRNDLYSYGHQCVLEFPVSDSETIFRTAFKLYKEIHDGRAIRSIGVRAIKLTPFEGLQYSLFSEEKRSRRRADLENTVDMLREKYGRESLLRGILYADRALAEVDPKEDHIIHPVGFFK